MPCRAKKVVATSTAPNAWDGVGTAGADAVVIFWLLHLLGEATPAIAKAVQVLRPGSLPR